MKKFNKYSLLFAFFVIFVVVGIWGNCSKQLMYNTIELLAGIKNGNIHSVIDFKNNLENTSNKELSYHDKMVDINSLKDNLLGTRIVYKDDTTVIKSDSGSLIEYKGKISKSKIDAVVSNVEKLKTVSNENGADFIYCAVPTKEYFEAPPVNVKNYSKENFDSFISLLNEEGVPNIDFSELLNERKKDTDIFYYTDHHWTSQSGFAATEKICEELDSRYNFSYNRKYTDINNYDVTEYHDWFLGSMGKKTGTYFTWNGADNFDLIIPKFKTDMTEEQPIKNQVRNGKFEDTVLFQENMVKDYYNNISYSTYSGGDFRLQIMKNNLNHEGKKILMIRDSYAGVVAPFLSLQTSELHLCDVRDYEYYVGDKINAEEYIKEIKPDYVLVLYSGIFDIDNSNGRYDFF